MSVCMGMTNDVRALQMGDVRSTRCEWYEDLAWGTM